MPKGFTCCKSNGHWWVRAVMTWTVAPLVPNAMPGCLIRSTNCDASDAKASLSTYWRTKLTQSIMGDERAAAIRAESRRSWSFRNKTCKLKKIKNVNNIFKSEKIKRELDYWTFKFIAHSNIKLFEDGYSSGSVMEWSAPYSYLLWAHFESWRHRSVVSSLWIMTSSKKVHHFGRHSSQCTSEQRKYRQLVTTLEFANLSQQILNTEYR